VKEVDAIAMMQHGDIRGLAALVEAYQLRAVRTAMLITRDQALAEDVVQSAFLRAFEKIHQFDASRPFAPWFMRSVVNAAVQAAKKQQRSISLDNEVSEDTSFEDLLSGDSSSEPHQALELQEDKRMIRNALDKLSPDQRAAVVMRYYLDMSESEMSELLQTPAGTIKWRLHHARKRLKGLLEGLFNPKQLREAD
jgi:RNA polymerase sigma-70 factor (ECF subfamily)